jgi:exonuclease SbcD
MRILHTADEHIGETGYSRVDPETGLNSRGLDFLNSFKNLGHIALDKKADVLLVVGDFFTRVNPHPRHLYEVLKTLRTLTDKGLRCIFISGNHETPRIATTLNPLLFLEQIEGVHVVLKPMVVKFDDIDFVCVPGPSNFDEIKTLFEPMLQEAMQKSKSKDRVLAAHVPLAQATASSEKALEFFMGEDLDIRQIPQTFSYVALGHVHKFQQIPHTEVPVCYSGSSERHDFIEEGQDKFAVLVDMEGETQITPVKLPARELLTVVDAECAGLSAQQITGLVLDEIESKRDKIRDALVRVKLERISVGESRLIDWPKIRVALNDCGVFDIKIQPRTVVSLPGGYGGEYIYPPSKELELLVKAKPEYESIAEDLLRLGKEVVRESRERVRAEA